MAMNVNTVNIDSITNTMNNNSNKNNNTPLNIVNLHQLTAIPMTTLLPPLSAAIPITLPSRSCSNLMQIVSPPSVLQIELDQKTKQIQLMQSAYWSLKADFDKVCDIVKAMETSNTETATKEKRKRQKQTLQTIIEEDDDCEKMKEVCEKNKELEKELCKLRELRKKNMDDLKSKNREINKRNNGLEKDIKNLKHKLKRMEKENRKLSNLNYIERNKKEIKQNTLNELYLNSSRIREFMNSIKKYGEEYKTLKKRQINLTKCIGKEDNDTLSIRMNDLYLNIVSTESCYHKLYEALDVIKTESQGKEIALMTADKEYILLLEKEKFISSSHLEEYVKKNQTLQTDLTDREMKLRQTQNEVAFVKQKLNRLQIEYNQLINNLNIYNQYQY